MSENKLNEGLEKEVLGFGGEIYTLAQLKEKCPNKDELKKCNDEYEKTKKENEDRYNSNAENLLNKIWVRLSQKGYGKYFVSNEGRIKW